MIYKILIFITLFTPLTDSFRAGVSFSKPVEKRLHKSLDQYFEKEDYHKTELLVEDSVLNETNSFFYHVENISKTQDAYMVITIANGCKLGGCDVEHGQDEEFEQFYVLSIYSEDSKLQSLKIIDYPSEHGYEVTSKWWLKQFIKHQGDRYEYSKNIDAISGATISVKSMIREVSYIQKCMPSIISNHNHLFP